jgi:predicted nuclease of restriction endonuclease-like (RecB) superfamily
MRLFYLHFPQMPDASGKLTRSHYVEILGIENELARGFYEQQSIKEKWSVRELKRNKEAMLFERLALSKSKQEVLKLAKQGQEIEKAEDILREPYVLEFLGIPESTTYSEKELEQKIIDHLQLFLLEF